MSPNNARVIVIVGGLSAGPSAATRARRLDPNARIILFEKGFDISYATCGIPYLLSGTISEIDQLNIVSADFLTRRFGIEVRLNEEVLAVDPGSQTIETALGTYRYDKLIYAAGASPIIPSIEGLQDSSNWSPIRTLGDTRKMIEELKQNSIRRVVIVGGGLIGCEVGENLRLVGLDVTILEGSDEILGPWSSEFGRYASQILTEQGVKVMKNTRMKDVVRRGQKIVAILAEDGTQIDTDYLVLAIGVRPNTQLLTKMGAASLNNGALIVTSRMETSLPNIYAAGDCASVTDQISGKDAYYPMGTHSNKAGRIAGANAAGDSATYSGGSGTGIVKLFKTTFARTGMHPKTMTELNIPYETTSIIAPSKPAYMPNSADIWVQIYYDPESLRILGAELAGDDGVDKRIDVLATAIYGGLTVEDLSEIDLAYAPPFSPAKDPVAVAGYSAINQHRYAYVAETPYQIQSTLKQESVCVIDVRSHSELVRYGTIKNALSIPLDELSQSDLPVASTYVVFCQKGLRGYLATRVLAAKGYSAVINISGGFEAWRHSGFPVVSFK